jgi:acetyl esterase
MPLDPTAKVMLDFLGDSLGIVPGATPEEVRANLNAALATEIVPKQPVHEVADRTIPGPDGAIPVRVYRPSADDGLPVLVWLHGGGWVIGSLDTCDQLCRLLCDASGAIVVSVDYRLAPEAKFPCAVDDCVAAWVWVAEHAAELGGDPARVALGGDSAGGNLAAVVSLVARDRALPAPALQLLVYPVTDYEFESPSMIENATGYMLETEHIRWFFDHYAQSVDDVGDWRCSPLRARDLAGLPPAVVITAEFDPLRDQGEEYGRRLQAAGVPTEVVRADGVFHGFFGMHAFLAPGQASWDRAVEALVGALEGSR